MWKMRTKAEGKFLVNGKSYLRRKRDIDVDVPETIKLRIRKANERINSDYSNVINLSSGFEINFDKTMEIFFSIKSSHETEKAMKEMIGEMPKKIKRKPLFEQPVVNTPLGDWIDGKTVRYAMRYKIGDSYSGFGNWSEPFVVDGKACPTLGVPVVRDRFTRLVYRKFNDEEPQLVAILDQKMERFRDMNRDIYNAASNPNEELAIHQIEVLSSVGGNTSSVFENGRRPIHAAAEHGNLKVVSNLLSKDFQAKDDYGFTPLHHAVGSDHDELVEILKADVNSKTNLGLTPLHIAAYQGYRIAVEKLIENGSNIKSLDNHGFTPFHHAVFNGLFFNSLANNHQSESLTALHIASVMNIDELVEKISQIVDVNAKTEGFTALHLATLFGNAETVRSLVKRVDINAKSVYEWTALHFAVALGKEEIVEILAGSSKVDLNAKGAGEVTPLHMAVISEREDIVKILLGSKASLEDKTDLGLTPLHIATKLGNKSLILILIDNGADVNAKTADGLTPMFLTDDVDLMKFFVTSGIDSSLGQTYGMVAAEKCLLNLVKYYVENDNGKSDRDQDGNTLLHYATLGGNLEVVKYVALNLGINGFDSKNNDGASPLHLAALKGHDDILKFLIQNKDANELNGLIDNNGDTVLHYAVKGKHLSNIKYLIETIKFNINTKNRRNDTVLDQVFHDFVDTDSFLVLFLATNYAKGRKGRFECNALHLAAYYGKLALVKSLLKIVDINSLDEREETPFHFAIRGNHLDVAKYLLEEGGSLQLRYTNVDGETLLHIASIESNLETLKYVVQTKVAAIDARDSYDWTPLHVAANYGNLEAVKFLFQKGAYINAVDNTDSTPVHFAAMRGEIPVLKFFAEQEITDFSVVNDDSFTPLQLAINQNQTLAAEYLKSLGRRRRSVDNYTNIQIKPVMPDVPLISDSKSDINVKPYQFHLDMNGTLLLFDVIMRKITGQKYVCDISDPMSFAKIQACALNITNDFESLMRRSSAPKAFDFFQIHKEITKKLAQRKSDDISKLLSFYVEKSGIESKEAKKLLSEVKRRWDHPKQ